MRHKLPQYIVVPFFVFAATAMVSLFFYFYHRSDPRAAQADSDYRAGEAAKVVADRKKSFNEALSYYLEMENDYDPRFGNGKLYYNIGNTYFQLEAYPWAVLYYLRAEALMPRDKRVERNLQLARSKLSLPQAEAGGQVLPLALSLPERLQLFAAAALTALLLLSAWLWTDRRGFRNGALVVLVLAAMLSLTLAYTRYFAPLEGVLVQGSDLYRDAGRQYAKVGEEPLPAGSEVELLGSDPSGKWFKILTPQGAIGYVPQEALRAVGE